MFSNAWHGLTSLVKAFFLGIYHFLRMLVLIPSSVTLPLTIILWWGGAESELYPVISQLRSAGIPDIGIFFVQLVLWSNWLALIIKVVLPIALFIHWLIDLERDGRQ